MSKQTFAIIAVATTVSAIGLLPIAVTVERVTKDANGGVATVNNLVALCTLSLWPCVDSKIEILGGCQGRKLASALCGETIL